MTVKLGKEYLLGDTIRLRVTFKVLHALIDPTTVIFKVKSSDKSIMTYTYPAENDIIRDSEGEFHLRVVGNKVGQWYYRAEGTGAAAGVEESAFYVIPSLVVESV
ncbi:MAG: hypothetical protein ABI835_02040 [Chloroflexota bacterium]